MPITRMHRLAAGLLAVASAACAPAGDRVVAPDAPPVSATPSPAVGLAALPSVHLSEIHYDNVGADVDERIEITAPAGTDLSGWSVVLYNGSNGTSYDTRALVDTVPDQCDGRGTVVLAYPPNGIQNGDPDGVALVNGTTVVEFLSWEGTFAAANGPAAGLTSVDIGVAETASTPVGESLQRTSAGWSPPAPHTFGACNPDSDVEVATVTVSPDEATIVEGATRAFSASARAENGDPAPATFAWSTGDAAVATVDPATGVVTGVAAGTTTVRATAQNGVFDEATVTVVAPSGVPPVRFSEIHYDNAGEDVGEAIEIEAPAGTSLAGWSVVLYNGSNGAPYDTRALSGTVADQCDGRGTIAVEYPPNGIQNGSPDAFALVNGETVVEFLSYEGTLTAVGGPADGLTSADIGVAEAASTPIGQSLQRAPDGTWSGPAPASFGACNGGGGEPPPPGNTISFSGRDAGDPPLPVGFEDQLFATLRSGATTIPTTFTWRSETPSIASVDEDGVVRALAAGTATIRATAEDGTTATYALPTRVGAEGPAEYAGNTEFGIPTDGDPSDDYILEREEFTASYNRLRNIPNWVSYNLDANDLGGEDRCDCFTFDPLLPATFARYTTADYTGAGAAAGYGIDRGHLAPSADRTSGSLDNARTFYFSNIIPQAADNNQGPWASFENHLRDLVRGEGRELYVVTGAYGSRGTVKDEGVITIPERTWKVVLVLPAGRGLADVDDPSDVLEVIAIDLPNAPGIRNDPWQSFRTTVDAIEAASGYDLLARLPDATERVLEAQLNVRNYAMDIRPSPLSLANTPVVNAVLLSRPDFDATLVDAANVRLVVNGGAEVQPNRRGAAVNTSVADFDGDGRADRLVAFRMSDLRAAGFSASARDLVLRPAGASPAWEARDATPPTVTP